MNLNVNTRFASMQGVVSELREEFKVLRAEMVSKIVFDGLEGRVIDLETNGLASAELKILRQQVSKLDSVNKFLRFRNLEGTSAVRTACVEGILQKVFWQDFKAVNIEHVYKGPPGQRVLTDMCVAELGSNSVREMALRELNKQVVKDAANREVKVDRAKTASQLQRNVALRKASDRLKADGKNQGKAVTIVWKKENDSSDKAREVHVGGILAFCQKIDDVQGVFVAPFSGMTL